MKKSICFACYNPGHRSKGCAQRRTCKSCSRRHPTGLDDDSFSLNQEASKQVNSTPPQRKENVSNAHAEVDEALCNAVGTEGSVTAVRVVPASLKSAEVLTYAMLDTGSTGSFLLDDITATSGVKGVNTQLMVKTVITSLSVPEVKKCVASGCYVVNFIKISQLSTYHRNTFAVNYRSARKVL